MLIREPIQSCVQSNSLCHIYITKRSKPLCSCKNKSTIMIPKTHAQTNLVKRSGKGCINIAFVPVRCWFLPNIFLLSQRLNLRSYGLSAATGSNSLGCSPFFKYMSCTLKHLRVGLNLLLSKFHVSTFPKAPHNFCHQFTLT